MVKGTQYGVPVNTYERGSRYSGLDISLVFSLLWLLVYQPHGGDAPKDTVRIEQVSHAEYFPVYFIGSTGLLLNSPPDLR